MFCFAQENSHESYFKILLCVGYYEERGKENGQADRQGRLLFVVIQLLNHVWLFAAPWTAACQAPLSHTISWSLLKVMSIESVLLSNHLICCHPLLLPSIFLASGSFPMSQFFSTSGQSIGASTSASVLPMNIQDWLPLRFTGLISLLSKGLSRVFSSTTIWRHQFFGAQPSLWSNSHTCKWRLLLLVFRNGLFPFLSPVSR